MSLWCLPLPDFLFLACLPVWGEYTGIHNVYYNLTVLKQEIFFSKIIEIEIDEQMFITSDKSTPVSIFKYFIEL